ncbi:hypothetical protein DMY87_19855 [Rhizobium wuzhouense]|uniref:Uncharacterized protein n=2 Tax=Rhizobium wuzhouense TaxID=1986026 RepID=A0ABX5NNI9_9HYPH|nr:hypothetical protein DMY87_19855 [Rhizobium wuzhouense]
MVTLAQIVREHGEIELAQLSKAPDQTDEQFANFKNEMRTRVFKIAAIATYDDGTSIQGDDPALLDRADETPLLSTFYVSNIQPFKQNLNTEPDERFELFLDFRFPPLFDPDRLVSSPTENYSRLTINGFRGSWEAGIEKAVRSQILRIRPVRTFIHGPFIYDLFLMLLGFPFAFYCCWLLSSEIKRLTTDMHFIVAAGAYTYVALGAVWVYRFLFSYTKWAFPLVELKEQGTRPALHRKVWWGLVALISGKLFWDLVDPLLSLRPLLGLS